MVHDQCYNQTFNYFNCMDTLVHCTTIMYMTNVSLLLDKVSCNFHHFNTNLIVKLHQQRGSSVNDDFPTSLPTSIIFP